MAPEADRRCPVAPLPSPPANDEARRRLMMRLTARPVPRSSIAAVRCPARLVRAVPQWLLPAWLAARLRDVTRAREGTRLIDLHIGEEAAVSRGTGTDA